MFQGFIDFVTRVGEISEKMRLEEIRLEKIRLEEFEQMRKRDEKDQKEVEDISEKIRLEVYALNEIEAQRKRRVMIEQGFDWRSLETTVGVMVTNREKEKEDIIDWEED